MPRFLLPSLRFLLGAGLLVGAMAPVGVAGQGRGCEWVYPTANVQQYTIPGRGPIYHLSRPSIRCRDGVRIQADSGVVYPDQSLSHLIGRVRFLDGSKEILADEGRYFSQQGRLQTNGNTLLRDTLDGSEITNGDMVLLRRTETRDQEQITVTMAADGRRPVAKLRMRPKADAAAGAGAAVPAPTRTLLDAPDGRVTPDSGMVVDTAAVALGDSVAGAPPPDSAAQSGAIAGAAAPSEAPPMPDRARPDTAGVPYTVEGNRIFLQGDQYFLASGDVVIHRDSLNAYADTAEYDQVAERMLLKGSARVEGDSYDLVGRTINLVLPGGEMREVRALREALLTGEDIRLRAPLIQLFLTDGAMERLVAVPLPGDPSSPPQTAADSADLARPVADAEKFRLTADSLEVLAPGEVLDRIFAAGSARGESSARDSLNVPSLPETALKDWLEGDTVIATFSKVERDPLLPPDTVGDEYRLEELRAVGSAKSLYRLLPSDSTSRAGVDPPAVHYVTGSAILIIMLNGEVDRMEVEGPTHGWHWEPQPRPQGRDSLVAPDSAMAPPDTGGVAQGGNRAPGPDGVGGRHTGEPTGGAVGGQGAALPAAASGTRGRGRRSRR